MRAVGLKWVWGGPGAYSPARQAYEQKCGIVVGPCFPSPQTASVPPGRSTRRASLRNAGRSNLRAGAGQQRGFWPGQRADDYTME